jgi:hypothetical protein
MHHALAGFPVPNPEDVTDEVGAMVVLVPIESI